MGFCVYIRLRHCGCLEKANGGQCGDVCLAIHFVMVCFGPKGVNVV